MSFVSPGDAFRYQSQDLRLTLVVLSVTATPPGGTCQARVLLLDVQDATSYGFRADAGQTTDWSFNQGDPEWRRLERLS